MSDGNEVFGVNIDACGLRRDCCCIDDVSVALFASGMAEEGGNGSLKVGGDAVNTAWVSLLLTIIGVEGGTSGDWPKTGVSLINKKTETICPQTRRGCLAEGGSLS